MLLVLLMGAFYSLALGYNYRYIILQLAKLEATDTLALKSKDVVLAYWPRKVEDFEKGSRWGVIPWCTPPDIIKVFWIAFLVCILGVTAVAYSVNLDADKTHQGDAAEMQPSSPTDSSSTKPSQETPDKQLTSFKSAIPYVGGGCFLLALLGPISFGRKMLNACAKEDKWKERDQKEETSPKGDST